MTETLPADTKIEITKSEYVTINVGDDGICYQWYSGGILGQPKKFDKIEGISSMLSGPKGERRLYETILLHFDKSGIIENSFKIGLLHFYRDCIFILRETRRYLYPDLTSISKS